MKFFSKFSKKIIVGMILVCIVTMMSTSAFALGRKLCITPRYLSIVCQKETGKTPSEWIREKTVGHIRHYLLNTTLSVKEICSVLDFPNSSFLCKFTKKYLGMSPMAFRQKNEKSNA